MDTINDLVGKIKELNRDIQKYEATGEPANDYRDKRNEYLDELSQYITFETNEQPDGTVMIYSEGGYLWTQSISISLQRNTKVTPQTLKPVWETGENYYRYDSLEYSSENNTDVGGLRGLFGGTRQLCGNLCKCSAETKGRRLQKWRRAGCECL